MHTTGLSPRAHVHPRRAPRARPTPSNPVPRLGIQVLDMATERSLIMGLRQHAPLDAERDLDPGVEALETLKDRLGLVMAMRRDGALIATIRFIPFGHGVTLAEKRWAEATRSREGFGAGSWEVGRLIVAPEHRSMPLLRDCLTLAMQTLVAATDAQHLHASCSLLMARLYRRFGAVVEETVQGTTGVPHVLIRAHMGDVARALGVDRPDGAGRQLYVNARALPQNTRYM